MSTYSKYKNVSMGNDCRLGDFSIIGMPPRNVEDGELATVLGDRVEIQSHVIINAGNTFGDDCTIGHGTYLRHNNKIGNRVVIGPHNTIEWSNEIEDDVTIETHSGVAEHTFVGRGTFIGAQASMASVLHPLCSKAKECTKGPHFERAVTVGPGAVIFPAVRIGEGAYVEPNTVVMRDVKPFTVVSGRYGRAIGSIFDLYPQLLKRIEPYTNLQEINVKRSQYEFDKRESLFPAQALT